MFNQGVAMDPASVIKNDDYCDLLTSGDDEPDTSACSHLHTRLFECPGGKFIFNSRVNDGEQGT
jgi:hypothetical protein